MLIRDVEGKRRKANLLTAGHQVNTSYNVTEILRLRYCHRLVACVNLRRIMDLGTGGGEIAGLSEKFIFWGFA